MHIYPIGTAGFIPTQNRETSCVLIKTDKSALLFDAGTGVRRLADDKYRKILSGIDILHVFLSHLHLDHTAGFTWLLRLWPGKIIVYIPTRPLVQFDGKESINIYTSHPFFGLPIERWPNFGGINFIDRKEVDCGEFKVRIIAQKHSGGSVGYRTGNFAYITDAEPGENHVDFIRDCELVLADTMYDEADFNVHDNKGEHGWGLGNAGICREANVKKLGLIHIDPSYNGERLDNLLNQTRTIFPHAFIPLESDEYYIAP